MVLSINTNIGAMVALQHLNSTNSMLEDTQLRITTGLRVNGPKDDASTYAIAQNMRGDINGMMAVKTAIAGGESTVNVALEGAMAINDLLLEMKAKVVQANQAGLDATSRTALHNDFDALRQQIETITGTAEFNGTNLIKASAANLSVLSTVDGSTIAVSAQTMDPTTLAIQTSSLLSSANAATALTAIDSAITAVADKLAALGSVSKRLEIQSDFTVKLIDILKAGVGNLVDADMAEESAKLQSLQIKQQLGVQALSIANSNPQVILSLFNG
ncbi:MAG: flagellin [Alphaproteobacteria bacterium]|nr:flagellin [Alphaproteobacteria bacterium]MDP6833311.1 flagellin [Alphaproteobacteria bacterium]